MPLSFSLSLSVLLRYGPLHQSSRKTTCQQSACRERQTRIPHVRTTIGTPMTVPKLTEAEKSCKREIICSMLRRIAANEASREPEPPTLGSCDERKLARLVRKYSRKAVTAAVAHVVPRGPGRPSRGLLPYHETMHLTDWAEAHRQELARLIRKHGRGLVAAAVSHVVPRESGRPSRGLQPIYELMHLTDWIEEAADEHRQAGSRKPYVDAELDVYEMQYDGEEKRPNLQAFRKTCKKKRLEGRRHWLELAQKVQENPERAAMAGYSLRTLPSWLKRFMSRWP